MQLVLLMLAKRLIESTLFGRNNVVFVTFLGVWIKIDY